MKNDNTFTNEIQNITDKIDSLVQYHIRDKCIPNISVTVVHKDYDKPLLEKVYNHPDSKSPIPSIEKTLFRTASVSKLFTYVALLHLVDRGLVSLSDPVQKYINHFKPLDYYPSKETTLYPSITVFHLIRHTSGLIREPIEGNYFNEIQCNLPELVESMNKSHLLYESGKTYKYSNAAVAMAGYVIEVVSGMSFEDYVEKNVLLPLGMTCSSFHNRNQYTEVKDENQLRSAVGHLWTLWDETDTSLSVFNHAPLTHFGMNPAGGLRITLREIGYFIRMFLNLGDPLLKTSTFMQFITPQPLDAPIKPATSLAYQPTENTHGLGVAITGNNGYLVASHGGAINGFASDFRVLPELGFGVYTVSTLDCCNTISTQISEYIVSLLAPHFVKPTHSPITSNRFTLEEISASCIQKSNQILNSIKASPISLELLQQIAGRYEPEKYYDQQVKNHYESLSFKIYQSYNEKVYISNPYINKIYQFSENELIVNDRLVSNQVIPFSIDKSTGKVRMGNGFKKVEEPHLNNLKNLFNVPYRPLPDPSSIYKVPPEAPSALLQTLVGFYDAKDQIALIFEEDGVMRICIEWLFIYRLLFISHDKEKHTVTFLFSPNAMYQDEHLVFFLNDSETVPIRVELSGIPFKYRHVGSVGVRQPGVYDDAKVRTVLEQSKSVPCPHPSVENHNLVDLRTLSSTLKFDIKYATSDNFLQLPFYDKPGAYLHCDAAKSLVEANDWLVKNWGVGIMVYDAYRPWQFTWAMSESVIPEYRSVYVADPNKGSIHNRGGAVDITLYDLKTGQPIQMPGDYDELSVRSHNSFIGGTSRQRWYKKLLAVAMMNHNFDVYPQEWWHFDFKSSSQFPVLNNLQVLVKSFISSTTSSSLFSPPPQQLPSKKKGRKRPKIKSPQEDQEKASTRLKK
eukprot:gene6224-7753_t